MGPSDFLDTGHDAGIETDTPGEYWASNVLGSVALPEQAEYLSPQPFTSSGYELGGTSSRRGPG